MDQDLDPDPGGPKTRGSGGLDPDSDPDPQHCSYVHIEFFKPSIVMCILNFFGQALSNFGGTSLCLTFLSYLLRLAQIPEEYILGRT
jgi:hypothetical protein